jgi:restriction system protein
MPPRRNKHLLRELAGLPWWVSVIVALVVFAAIRWLLPAVAGSNVILRGMGEAMRDKAWMFAMPFVVVAGVAAVNAWHRRRLFDDQTGGESPRAMTWQNFERLVGETYRRQGYIVDEVGGSAPDGGIDLVLHRGGGKTVVQCKRWKSRQVGVTSIREFFGVTVAENAERGIFVTSGTFTPDAVEFARGKPLELIDGARLAGLIEGLQSGATTAKPASEVPLGQSKPKGNAAPACPRCGGDMVRRLAKRGASAGGEFWGCLGYPKCSGTRDIEARAG